MKHSRLAKVASLALISYLSASSLSVSAETNTEKALVFVAGDASMQEWLLPDKVPTPKDNPMTTEKIALGKLVFCIPAFR